MLRLTINGIDAELYENAPVNLRLQYSDVTKIQNAAGSFSQTFRLPLTPLNRTIFDNIDEVGLRNGLNLQQRLEASLHSGTLPLMTGYVQVKAVYMTKEHYAEVEVVFFSGALDLRSELKGSLLSELDLSSHDHDLTYANVTSTWAGTGSIYPAIRYGLIDRGKNWYIPDNPVSADGDALLLSELTPFVQAKVLVEAILDEAGFTYESTLLTSADFANVYVPAHKGGLQIAPADVTDEGLRATLPSAGQTISSTSYTKVNFSDTLTGCYDPGSNYSTASDTYTAPYAGLYTIRFTYSWSNPNFPVTNTYFRIAYGSSTTQSTPLGTRSADNVVYVLEDVLLGAGDSVYVEVNRTGTNNVTLLSDGNYNTGQSTSLEVIAKEPYGGYEIGVSQNLPEMTQIDFLLSLQTMFNLVFVPDRNKPNHLHIETYSDYMGAGSSRDWTNKVDYSKDLVIKPTTDLQKREYQWTHAPGRDFINEEVQRSLDRVYGRQLVRETTNEFATGSLELSTSFAPFLVSNVPGSTIPIHRSLTSDGKGVDSPMPMICYYGGLSERFGANVILDETATQRTVTAMAFFGLHENDDPGVTDNDLSFGVELPLYSIAVNPSNTLYIKYWAQYVTELYSSDARIVTCHVRLTEADLADLEFNDVIYIRDTAYRILTLSYDANTPSVAKAELLMKLDDIALCEDTPTFYWSSQNVILFNGSNPGAPDYGTKTCCEFYGYRWDPNKTTGPRCRPLNAQLEI
jgi:hypothetical protein